MSSLIGEKLFHVGLIVMACSLVLFLAAMIFIMLAGRKLKQRLEREYGEKRH